MINKVRVLSKALQFSRATFSNFLSRHLGCTAEERALIYKSLGVEKGQDLLIKTAGQSILDPKALVGSTIPEPGESEQQFIKHMKELAQQNKGAKKINLIGGGFYGCHTPPVILRNLLQDPGWYTSYTPYQAEISQGRLYSLLIYQTMVTELTGLEVANASLLDQSSAGAEAMIMAYNNANQPAGQKFFLYEGTFPETAMAIRTTAKYLNIEVVEGTQEDLTKLDPQTIFGAFLQSPSKYGTINSFRKAVKHLQKNQKCLKILSSDLLALVVSKSAKELGFDVCLGNAQRFGVPMGFGGPAAAFFSFKQNLIRKAPGRIIGISKDKHGNQCYRMTLQTRQQHIKREKATSNICTAQALLANINAMYTVYHGPEGLSAIATQVNRKAQALAQALHKGNFKLVSYNQKSCNYLGTVSFYTEDDKIFKKLSDHGIDVGFDSKVVSISVDQTTTEADLAKVMTVLGISVTKGAPKPLDPEVARKSSFMGQKVFKEYRSQTQMMRFLNYLKNKDISLTKSMIPLGSCTLKLNAAAEMIPLSFPGFSNVHPYSPLHQQQGYKTMIENLGSFLCSVTGFDACSFQPNSGAQGEYAGLLTIRRYQQRQGQSNRVYCLIPKSAHGTNPASAMKAGLKVVPIQVNDGRIDMKDLQANISKYGKDISCLMVTFPSTAGIFESNIKEVCQLVHSVGAQVYMDGANMNAQVGCTSPGFLGADVCHLNLHKTFAIPHGGGGPGMGPIFVRAHLKESLPGFRTITSQLGSITSAPFGSASILTISYGYIRMLGRQGIREATVQAIVNANYLKKVLSQHYPILFSEHNCAHEFIIDMRPLKAKYQVSEEDVAKRLMDYGFHAPTMSFPVAGTLMVQPTESEDKGELDRFAEAMINIRKEMETIPEVLRNAPHTCEFLTRTEWKEKYSREQAAFPLGWIAKRGKYWPSVGRIDGVFGDKNLVCKLKE